MFLWAGLHQACIRNHSGAVKDLKFGRNERIYVYFEVIMFFRKDPPQTEGRRDADPLIKTAPDRDPPRRSRAGAGEGQQWCKAIVVCRVSEITSQVKSSQVDLENGRQ